MRNALWKVLLGLLALAVLLALCACGTETAPAGIRSVEKTGTEGPVDTYTITFTDGTETTFTVRNGEDGHTPVLTVGENGNWFVDDTDTGVPAQAESGENGLSAYELYRKYHPDYEGTEEEWVGTFYAEPTPPNGIVSVVKTGTEGRTDTYTITFTDGTTTTFTVQNGENGHTPVLTVGENGNWFADGADTGVPAQAEPGENGLSAYELYRKYHPDYEGTEEEWVDRFFRDENNLELFVSKMDLSSCRIELSRSADGVLQSDQVYLKNGNDRYWKILYNERDAATGTYFRHGAERYYSIGEEDEEYMPESLILYDAHGGFWYRTENFDRIFLEMTDCEMQTYGYELYPEMFEPLTDLYFRALPDCATDAGKLFFTDRDGATWDLVDGKIETILMTEEFHSFEVEIVGGSLRVTATSTLTVGEESQELTYEAVLSGMGVTKVAFPDYIEEPEEGFPTDRIADLEDKEPGDDVRELTGYVLAYMDRGDDGCDVWMSDMAGSHAVLVHFRGFGHPYGLEVGRNITISGTAVYEAELIRVVVNRSADYELRDHSPVAYPQIEDLSGLSYADADRVFDLCDVTADRTELTGEDIVTLTDREGHTLDLWVKEDEVEFFNGIFSILQPGDRAVLRCVTLEPDWEGLILCLTGQSEVHLEYGVLLSYPEKSVTGSFSLEEALSDLVVQFRGDDGTLIQLESGQYGLTCADYDPSRSGVYTVTVSYLDKTATVQLSLSVPEVREHVSYPTLEQTTAEKMNGQKPLLPSTGDVDVLVIPIGFSNTDYEKYGDADAIREKLTVAFAGTNEQTGWYSLSGYYRAASYDRLRFNPVILDIYQTGEEYDLYAGEAGDQDWRYLLEALAYNDDGIDYSAFDQNGDGNIDCVYLVYLAPYSGSDDHAEIWWAYTNHGEREQKFDGVWAYGYLWFSYEFFDEPIDTVYEGGEISEEKSLYVNVNCETVIHETGHALGLDDYYDYYLNRGVIGGAGSFPMMDANQGDHDPYSKAILGWTEPTVVFYDEYDTTLRSFEKTGDMVILSKTDGGTYFEEYFIVALYTPTGVNELKSDRDCGLPSVPGVMVWHIDATLRSDKQLQGGNYFVWDITKNNNGSGVNKLIDLVCADGSTDIDTVTYYEVQDKDLFAPGSVISGLKWYDGTDVGAEIAVGALTDSEGTGQVTISIRF